MSNFKKRPSVPKDNDIRQIGDTSFIVGGTLSSSTILPAASGTDETALVLAVSGGLQGQINIKANSSFVNALSGTLQAAVSDLEDFKPADTWYVDGINGSDVNSSFGSFTSPYKTIGAALSGIGNLSLQKIFILAADSAAPIEQLVITQSDLIIQGIGTTSSYAFTVNASLTLSGANRLQLKDLHLHNTVSGVPCIKDIGASGVNNFDNITLTSSFPDQLGYQTLSGTNGGGTNFTNCTLSTVNVEINGASDNTFNFMECLGGRLSLNSGNFVFYRDSRAAGPFIHTGGTLILNNIITLRTASDSAGDSVISTTSIGDGIVSIGSSSTVQQDGIFGAINKTGSCPIAISTTQRDPTGDTITGFRFYPLGSFDISGTHAPTNYTAANEFVPAHFEGIDIELGLRSRRVAIPPNANSIGAIGDYAVDGNYRYDCISTDSWVRMPVSTW